VTNSLKEAFEQAGIFEKLALQQPKTKWHEIFKVTLTKFEIPLLIKVQCTTESQGLRAIASRKLNSIEATSSEEAQIKINEALCKWTLETGSEAGKLLYWKFYK
jgi:hypothetical protein